MTIKEARPIIKAYYSDNGETATVVGKLEREVEFCDGTTYTEESFLCHVKLKPDPYKRGKASTVCTIGYDRYGNLYATEFTSGDNDKEAASCWLYEEY